MFGFSFSSKSNEPLHEFWHEYTSAEIAKIKHKKCRKCPYKGSFSSSGGDGTTMCCDYLIITGQSRGCRPELCEHYLDLDVEKKNAFTQYTPLKKEQIYG